MLHFGIISGHIKYSSSHTKLCSINQDRDGVFENHNWCQMEKIARINKIIFLRIFLDIYEDIAEDGSEAALQSTLGSLEDSVIL